LADSPFLLQCLSIRSLEREGLEGSLAKFGLGVGYVCFANVPDEGNVCSVYTSNILSLNCRRTKIPHENT
jgi:hypothetical protein